MLNTHFPILETFHRRQTRSAANVPALPFVHVRHDSTAARSSDPAIRCAMADNPRADCRIEQPTNDENPVLLPIFVYRLAMWIEARHTNFRRFVETGTTIYRMTVVVWDVTHALRVYEGKQIKGTFSAPFSPSPAPELSPELLAKYGTGDPPEIPTELPDVPWKFPRPAARRGACG